MQMEINRIHVCREQPDAPARDGEFADGTRWVCRCGSNFVYREGFTRAGRPGADWWEAPPVPIAVPIAIPVQRRADTSVRIG